MTPTPPTDEHRTPSIGHRPGPARSDGAPVDDFGASDGRVDGTRPGPGDDSTDERADRSGRSTERHGTVGDRDE